MLTATKTERNLFKESLQKFSLRVDGRHGLQERKVTYKVDEVDLSEHSMSSRCEVNFGETKIVAYATGEIVQPKENRTSEGSVHINIPEYWNNSQNISASQISRVLELSIRETGCVDLELLCIKASEAVWKIVVDINILIDDGNIVDASHFACLAALKGLKLSQILVEDDELKVQNFDAKEGVALAFNHFPILVSLGFLELEEKVEYILDPTNGEEQYIQGKMYIVVNENKEICTIQKIAYPEISEKDLNKYCDLAIEVGKKRLQLLNIL
eukprot:snap_masked-scaffold_1-processed-gene-20.37-mRNA-1 protein AED:1.00 eAED:1.00 QI:0/-1/0/0/-1/1/1/0/269